MQIKTNLNNKLNLTWKQLFLAVAFLFLLIAGAKLDIDLGGLVSFTLQTLFLGLAYYFLPRNWKLAMILSYLLLGILGLPVFNGGAGWSYFSSWPLGFFIGFVAAAAVTKPVSPDFYSSLSFFIQIHVIILVLGSFGVGIFAGAFNKGLETCLELLPGAVLKSVIDASIIWVYHTYVARFNTAISNNKKGT